MTAALHGFELRVQHIPGADYRVADSLSRPCILAQLRAPDLLPNANATGDPVASLPARADM